MVIWVAGAWVLEHSKGWVALVTAVVKGSDGNSGTSKSSQACAAWRLSTYSSPVLVSGLRASEGPIT